MTRTDASGLETPTTYARCSRSLLQKSRSLSLFPPFLSLRHLGVLLQMSRQSPIPRPKGIPELEPEDVPADNRRSGRLFKVQLFWRDPTTKRYWCRYPQCPYSNKDSPTVSEHLTARESRQCKVAHFFASFLLYQLAISHYKHVHMGKRKIRYKKLCKLCDYLTSVSVEPILISSCSFSLTQF